MLVNGFSFVVEPDMYVVHRPHASSGARKLFVEGKDAKAAAQTSRKMAPGGSSQQSINSKQPPGFAFLAHVHAVWLSCVKDMEAKQFKPQVDQSAAACFGVLPWWKQ
jgi:hypothetical protein